MAATPPAPPVICRTKYFNYGRPWSNPYKSIYNGATYIANGFSKTQNTGYLQKFNVAPGTAEKHSHEYMANVQAAASESVTTYNAYKSAKILNTAKTFIIPVYSGMPASTANVNHISTSTSGSTTTTTRPSTTAAAKNRVTGLTLTGRTQTNLTYKWNKVSGATKYYIDITNKTKGTNFSKTVTGTSATLHNLTDTQNLDVLAYEKEAMDKLGLIPEIAPRYRTTYFNHIIGGYAAGYYSYLWANVLDNDAFEAFKEHGIFDKKTADLFRNNVLEKGNSEDPMTLYKNFRGTEPQLEPMLRNRGMK